jgi:hypothetical protein
MEGDCRCLLQRPIPGKTLGNHENVSQANSWIRFPMKIIFVGRKLRTTEERRQDQSCLFRRGDYGKKGHNSEKLSCIRDSVNMVSVARKPTRRKSGAKTKVVCFGEKILGTQATTPTNPSSVRVLVKMISVAS